MADIKSKGILLSLSAGTMAALASVSAKLATSSEADKLSKFILLIDDSKPIEQDSVTLVIRVISVCGIFLCNALMWTLFTKSLQHLPSLHATITNTAANFLVSAIIGKVLFGEVLELLWWIGSLFILLGLLLIHRGTQIDDQKKHL
ncbi:hypothetical protein SNE40_017988 [Patella caerulea]|uniref:EamA domain-containing protein n=1 Tax=Patella caerulea TaxID=87958 RepID=A0AAN8JDB5_PATCE